MDGLGEDKKPTGQKSFKNWRGRKVLKFGRGRKVLKFGRELKIDGAEKFERILFFGE